MRKIKIKITSFILSTSLFILIIFHAGCSGNNIANLESRGKNIICFGDSITRGKGVNPDESYPAALAKMSSLPVINAGINSDISPEAVKRVQTDVLDNDPLLVIIEFGGNDYLNKVPLEETIGNIEAMVKAVQARGAMVAIADISNTIFMGEYNQELKRLSRKYRAIFIPRLLEGIVADPSLKSDAIHPNAKGYKIIAYRVYRGIISSLNRNAIWRGQQKKIFDSSKAFR
jgi:acyl-CoA thioesterase I